MTQDTHTNEATQPRRAEGSLELRVWGATDEQLVRGLASARELLAASGTTAGRAVVCQSAVTAYELDTSLPEPSLDVREAARICRQASDAAILAAGGAFNRDDALAFEQNAEDARLWDTLPTLRAWRDKSKVAGSAEAEKPR